MRWLALLVGIAACERGGTAFQPPTADVERNIARADYIGPRACGECHAEQLAAWSASLHRVMNARADEQGAVIGDFGDARVAYAGGEARFSRDGSAYMMTLARDGRVVRYRVTRTIGRRGLQEYVGIEDGPLRTRRDEVRLPFGWWPKLGGWFPQPYFDPWLGDEAGFDAFAPVREPWAERCPWCHSTYPFELRIARAAGPKHLGHGLEQLFTGEPGGERLASSKGPGSPLGGEPDRGPPRRAGIDEPVARPSAERLAVGEQVTTGISCESCHLGGRAHAAGAAIHFVPHGAPTTAHLPAAFAEERRDATIVNGVCAQCHSGPSPRLADGTALRNSSEALDLAASPCTGIKCTDCHDPHRADARADDGRDSLPAGSGAEGRRGLIDARSIAACTHCHAAQAGASHAGSGHASVTCLDCHMPRVVMGIDRFVRTHRISAPTDPRMLGADAPNACNVCHLDRTFGWTRDALADGWDVRVRTSGELDTPAGEAWLASPTPALRVLSAHAYARSPLGRGMLRELARGLDDRLAYVRAWTQLALEQLLGRRLDYDPRAPGDVRRAQLARLRL